MRANLGVLIIRIMFCIGVYFWAPNYENGPHGPIGYISQYSVTTRPQRPGAAMGAAASWRVALWTAGAQSFQEPFIKEDALNHMGGSKNSGAHFW